MSRKIFVNFPVRDLKKTVEFFSHLGFNYDARFTNESAACMVVSPDIFVMFLVEEKFGEFTTKEIADAKSSTEVLVCLSCESRAEVDDLVRKAVAAGGSTYSDPQDYGFMYGHGFQDLDGHLWEVMYMEPPDEEGDTHIGSER